MRAQWVLVWSVGCSCFLPAPAALGAQETAPGAQRPASASGFGLAGAQQPAVGVLFGGQPEAAQLEAMAAAGFATVIDLRAENEARGFDETALASRLGLAYHNIPVGATTLRDPATFERFFAAFDNAEKPVLVHCATGNRVAALYYAYLVGKGTAREEALILARRFGLRSEALVEAVNAYLDSGN